MSKTFIHKVKVYYENTDVELAIIGNNGKVKKLPDELYKKL